MKPILHSIAAGGLLAVVAAAQPLPRYIVKDLGTLGGNFSVGFQMNNAGWVAGQSNVTAGGPQHSVIWYGPGSFIDLGTLEGAKCPDCNSGADGPNALGEAAVGSEISAVDSDGEDFCAYGTHHQCLGAVWRGASLTALSTLPNPSGLKHVNNANAFDINNRGQVIGFSEDGVYDTNCMAGATGPQLYHFQPVIWDANGQIRALPLLQNTDTAQPPDQVGFAFGINDRGQVIGSSGLCSTSTVPPNPNGPHAVLWEPDGTPVNLGSLNPGNSFNVASSINNRGEVVGGSQVQDGTIHPFLWTMQTGMIDLGAYPGALVTVPPCCHTINNSGEIVGFALDGTTFQSRAVIWRNRTPIDLNTLVDADSPLYLTNAASINDAGEITGQGMTKSGEMHAFLAIPIGRQ